MANAAQMSLLHYHNYRIYFCKKNFSYKALNDQLKGHCEADSPPL